MKDLRMRSIGQGKNIRRIRPRTRLRAQQDCPSAKLLCRLDANFVKVSGIVYCRRSQREDDRRIARFEKRSQLLILVRAVQSPIEVNKTSLQRMPRPVRLWLGEGARKQRQCKIGRELVVKQRIALRAQPKLAAQTPHRLPPMVRDQLAKVQDYAIYYPTCPPQAIGAGDIHQQRGVMRREERARRKSH